MYRDGHTLRNTARCKADVTDSKGHICNFRSPAENNIDYYFKHLHSPFSKKMFILSDTSFTDIPDFDKYPIWQLMSEQLPFYKLENVIKEQAITLVKQGYRGKYIECYIPIANVISNQYSDEENQYKKNIIHNQCMIYMAPSKTRRVYIPLVPFDYGYGRKSLPSHQICRVLEDVRQFSGNEITKISHGLINIYREFGRFFTDRYPQYGHNKIIFNFGSFKQITHIETYGNYPHWENINGYATCTEENPFYYVKKYEIHYKKGKNWISAGIYTGNNDILNGNLHQVDIFTQYIRITPIEFHGGPSMEILIFGKQSENVKNIEFKKYMVHIPTKYVPDGRIYRNTDYTGKYNKNRNKKQTKYYLDEYFFQ